MEAVCDEEGSSLERSNESDCDSIEAPEHRQLRLSYLTTCLNCGLAQHMNVRKVKVSKLCSIQ